MEVRPSAMEHVMKNNNGYRKEIRLSRTAYFIATQLALGIGLINNALARDVFNPAMLELGTPGQTPVDLSVFEVKGGQMPGTYHVDIYLNNEHMDTRDVEFRMMKDAEGKESLQPCLSVDELANWGVLVKKFPELGGSDGTCADLAAIPQASSDLHFERQQLLLSFPQSSVKNAVRGWVDPQRWDDGIMAALLNYSVSGANNWANDSKGSDSDSQYVNLRPGINIGPWRLRNYTTWNRSGSGGTATSHWDTVYTYIQRDIHALKSQLTLGDSTTPSDVFDSIPFRGAQIASDDEMLPESLRGYAPVVRGIARSNAQVTIRQNGYVIYQTYVSPGSFEITDMYPTGSSGDLYVTIKESDGSEQQLVVPYASLPVLQREGRLKFSVTTGVYRAYDSSIDETPLSQGTAIYGLPAGFTLYGGVQASTKYQSAAFGVGKNLGTLGAVSTDVTQAWSHQKDRARESGQSWRVRYSKNFVQTGTNFSIAGYRYATAGYWNMQEVLDTYSDNNNYSSQERRRNRTELTMTQGLWQGGGNISLSAIREDYWNSGKRMESYGVSYNNTWNNISYGLSYTYNVNSSSSYGSSAQTYSRDQLFSFNISIPLAKLFGETPTYANYAMNSSKNGNTSHNVSLGGTLLENNNLSWSVMQGYGTKGQGYNGGVNADWRATYGEINGGYAYDQYSKRLNYGVQGGIVVHANGVTFGQPLGETIALVAAPGASGVSVNGQTGVRTDFRGYALVPYTSPYRQNDISLNTESFNEDTEVAITTQTVIPTRGAVVKASYQTSVGNRVLMTLLKANGKPVPFGATVNDSTAKGNRGFIVGDGGQVYLTGLPAKGQLLVKWGNGADEQCTVSYTVPDKTNGIANMNGLCR